MSSAEQYDVLRDSWEELPTLPRILGACCSEIYKNSIYLMSSATRQVVRFFPKSFKYAVLDFGLKPTTMYYLFPWDPMTFLNI